MTLTNEQRAAIDLRGRTVLVSAAAGAGKTFVLVERLMGYVLDERRPRNLDDFLLLTFTRAAAGEMRARILSRLRALLRENPSDAHLRAQQRRVYTAKICTLDAYCREILGENAALAGFPAGFRVGDEAELALLEARVLEDTLDELYEAHKDRPESPFSVCAAIYGDMRGDRALSELILSTWRKMRGNPDPSGWLDRQLESFRTFDPSWPMTVLTQALETAMPHRAALSRLLERVRSTDLAEAYGPALESDIASLDGLCAAFLRSWDAASDELENYRAERLRPARGTGEAALADEVKAAHKRWGDTVKKLSALICGKMDDLRGEIHAAAPVLEGLFEGVRVFDRNLRAEKLRLKALGFSDIEHAALELLAPGGGRGALAGRYSERFAEIMVDEYQDLSPVQNALVDALSKNGSNVFYVGDVRQAIYRFQMAEPALFLSKYNAFPSYEQAPPDGPCKVLLTKNFRSRPEVLDAVNHVLSRVDCPEMGPLRRENFLIAKKPPAEDYPAVELLESARGDDESRAEAEASAVARRLHVLLDSGEVSVAEGDTSRPSAPGDVVILMRSPGARAPYYRAALAAVGLQCSAPDGENYFERPEIETVTALLSVIDNALDDLAMLSVLRSPLVLCTPAELAALRLLSDASLFECVRASDNQKIKDFAKKLALWRSLSAELSPFTLAARILADTRLPGLYGGAARENLLELPEILAAYKGGDLRGLKAWIAGQAEKSRRSPISGLPENAVRLMSIHKSKGLEFPVVVLADMGKRFNRDDQTARLLIHPRTGLGPKLRDEYSEYPTVAWKAVRAVIDREMLSEELRLLYVGMTRAADKLILSCGPVDREPVPFMERGEMTAASSVADWLLPLRDPAWPVVTAVPPVEEASSEAPETSFEKIEAEAPEFIYPFAQAIDTPSKMTATGLKGRFIDAEAGQDAPPPVFEKISLRRPRLDAEERAGLTAAEKGSAFHLFMQFADFSKCRGMAGIEGERARLTGMGLLTREQAESVDLRSVVRFFQSETGGIMPDAGLNRECKFSVLVSAEDMPGLSLPPGERVLLQGVVDCWFEYGGGLCVIDFKTDRIAPGGAPARAEIYRAQLEAYSAALRMMTGRPVLRRLLVFFSTGEVVEV